MPGKFISGFCLFGMISLFWGFKYIQAEYTPTLNIDLVFCSGNKNRSDVRRSEEKRGSKLIELNSYQSFRWITKHLFAPEGGSTSDGDFFMRQSILPSFSEYVYHYYDINIDYPLIEYFYDGYSFIEFNCGTEPFGYDTTRANVVIPWEGRYPGLIPVRDVPLDSFKLGYYSIVKWLYDQETDRFKVRRRKYEQIDGDYGPTSSEIKSENLVLEDPWQEEFLFTTYELIDTRAKAGDDFPVMTVVPRTFAPIHLYEVRPPKSERENYVYAPDIYHINIADMAIRVYKHPLYEEL